MNLFVSQARATEKQKNKMGEDAGRPTNMPPLTGFSDAASERDLCGAGEDAGNDKLSRDAATGRKS